MPPHRLTTAALGAGLVAMLAFAAPAMASYSANVDGSTLRVAGDGDNVTINDLSGTPLEKVYVDLSDGRRVCWS